VPAAVTVTDVLHLLRPGLLDGRTVALAGPARPPVAAALADLGAETRPLEADLQDEPAVEAAAAQLGEVHALVVDAAALFAAAPPAPDEVAPLRAAADGAWSAARPIANAAWIDRKRPGKLVLLAPAPSAGPHAEAARAALENLARTLSIEWSRFGIKITAIAPADATPDEQVAALAAYLVSPAGDSFSGTRLDLS
jgi:NAD(P)-dependent dehydrogenase (short-subunit alcohol dehydrogenase family)